MAHKYGFTEEMKLNEIGERPPGALHSIYMEAHSETRYYLDGELIGTIPDRLMLHMARDGLAFDWDAWRAAKLTTNDHSTK